MGSNEYDVWHEFAHAAELQGKDLSKYGASEEERATRLGKLLSEGKDIPELRAAGKPASAKEQAELFSITPAELAKEIVNGIKLSRH